MTRIVFSFLTIVLLISCDPVSQMDANIKNTTSQKLTIQFDSSEDPSLNKTLVIESEEVVLFQDGFSTTGGFLEPTLEPYDSVYIFNVNNEVLRVYKQNTIGKNIYDVDNNWRFREPSKRVYEYDYEIGIEELGEQP